MSKRPAIDANPYASPQEYETSQVRRETVHKTISRTLLGLAVLLVLVGWYALIMRPWPNQASMTFNEWRELQKAQEQDTPQRSRSASEE